MNRLLFLLGLFTVSVSFFGKNVTGSLKSTEGVPIEYANIVLLTQSDSVFITGTTSDQDGNFTLLKPEMINNCLIKITCIGYKMVYKSIDLNNIGIITLDDDMEMLNEVVVKGDLPVTRLKADGMITNIEGSILAQAGTAQDLLNYIPGVASQKGSLQVLGRGAPVVYINGRLVRDNSELDQLSSDNIKSVEVINNPGARYAASVKAVIRIQTKKAVGQGLGFNNRTLVDYDDKYWDALEQINLNYRTGGLDVFGMLFLYQYKDWNNFALIQDSYLDSHWKQAFLANGYIKNRNLIADFGLNYVFNPNHSIGFKYRYDRTPKSNNFAYYDAIITENSLPYENTISSNIMGSKETQNSINIYYNGTAKDWNIDFNTDLLWTDEHENQHAKETITPVGGTSNQQMVTSSNETTNRLYASKLILTHPLFEEPTC